MKKTRADLGSTRYCWSKIVLRGVHDGSNNGADGSFLTCLLKFPFLLMSFRLTDCPTPSSSCRWVRICRRRML
jgi:hypothetical protein